MSGSFSQVAKRFRAPFETGITRLWVLKHDDWTCKMEICLYGDRRIDPAVRWSGTGAIPEQIGSVDHIVPLSAPGTPGHVRSNVRAAHRACNRAAGGIIWLTQEVALDWLKERADENMTSFGWSLGS
jgi:hypothetical protein